MAFTRNVRFLNNPPVLSIEEIHRRLGARITTPPPMAAFIKGVTWKWEGRLSLPSFDGHTTLAGITEDTLARYAGIDRDTAARTLRHYGASDQGFRAFQDIAARITYERFFLPAGLNKLPVQLQGVAGDIAMHRGLPVAWSILAHTLNRHGGGNFPTDTPYLNRASQTPYDNLSDAEKNRIAAGMHQLVAAHDPAQVARWIADAKLQQHQIDVSAPENRGRNRNQYIPGWTNRLNDYAPFVRQQQTDGHFADAAEQNRAILASLGSHTTPLPGHPLPGHPVPGPGPTPAPTDTTRTGPAPAPAPGPRPDPRAAAAPRTPPTREEVERFKQQHEDLWRRALEAAGGDPEKAMELLANMMAEQQRVAAAPIQRAPAHHRGAPVPRRHHTGGGGSGHHASGGGHHPGGGGGHRASPRRPYRRDEPTPPPYRAAGSGVPADTSLPPVSVAAPASDDPAERTRVSGLQTQGGTLPIVPMEVRLAARDAGHERILTMVADRTGGSAYSGQVGVFNVVSGRYEGVYSVHGGGRGPEDQRNGNTPFISDLDAHPHPLIQSVSTAQVLHNHRGTTTGVNFGNSIQLYPSSLNPTLRVPGRNLDDVMLHRDMGATSLGCGHTPEINALVAQLDQHNLRRPQLFIFNPGITRGPRDQGAIPAAPAAARPHAPVVAAGGTIHYMPGARVTQDPSRPYYVSLASNGAVLGGNMITQRADPASTTKVAALLTMADMVRKGELPRNFFQQNQAALADMIRRSDNDLANDFGDFAGNLMRQAGLAPPGSDNAAGAQIFIRRMNQMAAERGFTGTNFHTIDGMNHPNHYSTALDSARMMQAFVRDYPQLAPLASSAHSRTGGSAFHGVGGTLFGKTGTAFGNHGRPGANKSWIGSDGHTAYSVLEANRFEWLYYGRQAAQLAATGRHAPPIESPAPVAAAPHRVTPGPVARETGQPPGAPQRHVVVIDLGHGHITNDRGQPAWDRGAFHGNISERDLISESMHAWKAAFANQTINGRRVEVVFTNTDHPSPDNISGFDRNNPAPDRFQFRHDAAQRLANQPGVRVIGFISIHNDSANQVGAAFYAHPNNTSQTLTFLSDVVRQAHNNAAVAGTPWAITDANLRSHNTTIIQPTPLTRPGIPAARRLDRPLTGVPMMLIEGAGVRNLAGMSPEQRQAYYAAQARAVAGAYVASWQQHYMAPAVTSGIDPHHVTPAPTLDVVRAPQPEVNHTLTLAANTTIPDTGIVISPAPTPGLMLRPTPAAATESLIHEVRGPSLVEHGPTAWGPINQAAVDEYLRRQQAALHALWGRPRSDTRPVAPEKIEPEKQKIEPEKTAPPVTIKEATIQPPANDTSLAALFSSEIPRIVLASAAAAARDAGIVHSSSDHRASAPSGTQVHPSPTPASVRSDAPTPAQSGGNTPLPARRQEPARAVA